MLNTLNLNNAICQFLLSKGGGNVSTPILLFMLTKKLRSREKRDYFRFTSKWEKDQGKSEVSWFHDGTLVSSSTFTCPPSSISRIPPPFLPSLPPSVLPTVLSCPELTIYHEPFSGHTLWEAPLTSSHIFLCGSIYLYLHSKKFSEREN